MPALATHVAWISAACNDAPRCARTPNCNFTTSPEAARPSLFRRRVLHEIRLDERIQIAVEDAVDLGGLVLRPQIFHQLIRLEHVAADLVTPRDVALGGLVTGAVFFALGELDLVETS